MRFTSTVALSLLAVTSLVAQPSLDNILSPSRLAYLKDSRLIQISSHDTSGGNDDYIAIPVGATARIAEIQGPGVISNIWITIASPDKFFLRRILLRMYWDGEENPSVEVPIGDFFGTGFHYQHYITPYLGMSSGGYFCYFPMPFNRSARIEVVNETGQEINSFYYHIDYHRLSLPLEDGIAYFHATWRREPRTSGTTDFMLLEAEGRGHVVGINMSMQSYNNDIQFLEGDEKVFVDGETSPSIYGTGTEDYFNSGWYFNRGEFAAPYHGLILKDDSLQRIAAYRFHILDAIPFTRSVRFGIEHGDQNAEIADYSGTAYWYQKEPHKPLPPMLPAGMRIPLRVRVPNGALEAEVFVPQHAPRAGFSFAPEDMRTYGAEWSGTQQLKIPALSEGESFTLTLPAPEEEYDIGLYFTRGPAYGNADILSRGKKVGEIRGFDKTVVPGGRVALKDLMTEGGTVALQFVGRGRSTESSGTAIGLDAFILEPHRHFIPAWYMIGPFPNPRDAHLKRLGIDIAYPPEKGIDVTGKYPGVDQKPVAWTLDKTPANGRMDLYKYDPYEMVVVYALTYLYSPKDQVVPLLLGSDDGAKVFINGKEVHRVLKIRVAAPDQDRVPLTLAKGWNPLLLKIENNYGGYNFYARLLDPGHTVVASPTKEKQ